MNAPPDLAPDSAAAAAPVIELTQVHKTYREGEQSRAVLKGVDLRVARGSIVALLGRSGSGKSSLLNIVSGIDAADAGVVRIAGADLAALGERDRTLFRRRNMGFIFQFFNLIPTLTVMENLLLPFELNGRIRPKHRSHAADLLAEVGLGDRAGSYPDRLSGGEQQRVAVARALAHDPALVLADEPTGNLDEATGRQVMELLERLTRRAGRTMLIATHSREILPLADRVLRIEQGRLVEDPQAPPTTPLSQPAPPAAPVAPVAPVAPGPTAAEASPGSSRATS
ncbi:MAG: ABC transporter ATP-binding protein [Planctomycetota bacterium]